MELPPSPWITYSAFLALFVLLLLKAISGKRRRRHQNLPPGPRPWPIIGNLNLIGPLPHRSIHALSQRYGPLIHLRFGSFPVVVGSSADMARLFLKTHDLAFAGRPKTAAGKYTAYNYSDITWSNYGPYWRQARKMCITELFSPRRLDSYEHIRSAELRSLLCRLFAAGGEPVVLKDYLSTLSLNVISRMVFGRKYHDPTADEQAAPPPPVSPEEFKRMLDELFLLNGVLNIGDSIPWLNFLDLQGYIRRMKAVGQKLDRFMEHVLDEHIVRRVAAGENFSPKDMIDVLIQFAEDPSLDVELNRNSLKAFSQDLIAGGTESSAVTVEWALSELLKQPHIFKKAAEELDRVIGQSRWVEEKDVGNLPYIGAIVKETMRLHPVAPMLVPRLAREDVVIDGYDIPAGTRILVNMFTISRDPAIWDSPEEFRPERFLGLEVDVKGHDFELLPFGSGRRMCPGYTLGLRVIQGSLANILHGFKWRLPEGMKAEELSMEEIFGLSTPRKEPLVAVAEPRLPPHIYQM
ncbi:Flavonoid 3'-monooxygenase [Apostasia shenzhenica]|uniref:Flavonoid 3'-monooxygenase n=1 Tax=Apostasia shenzhenica TaxID=1088818 RepID=A0A2I0A361_9ASPA|nr:Flavonoid 3'-monooxygenase [Apostasia shenzhenica]